MARPKKVVAEMITASTSTPEIEQVVSQSPVEPIIPILPPKLSVDYASEGLNNMARTINEIIDYLNK